MPDVHAKLSASGAHKWLNCPASAQLETHFPDQSTAYAAEGTHAHAVAETLIKYHLAETLTKEEYEAETAQHRESAFYCEEMWGYVANYVAWVMETFYRVQADCPDAEILTEQRLDFSRWVPGGFGTGDVVILADDELTIIDLKYGKGVEVNAPDNPQLMLYALGAYETFGLEYSIKRVNMYINQPRLDHISEATKTIEELIEWGDTFVAPRAEKALKGLREAHPGEHCRFCKAKATCRARANEAEWMEIRYGEDDPGLLKPEEIADVLEVADRLTDWIKDIKAYALKEALNGQAYEGFKLVEGRSQRKIVDTQGAADALIRAGYDKSVIYKEPELLGITALQAVVGKKNFDNLIGTYIIKPQGAPALVPLSDKRPAITGAAIYNDGYTED